MARAAARGDGHLARDRRVPAHDAAAAGHRVAAGVGEDDPLQGLIDERGGRVEDLLHAADGATRQRGLNATADTSSARQVQSPRGQRRPALTGARHQRVRRRGVQHREQLVLLVRLLEREVVVRRPGEREPLRPRGHPLEARRAQLLGRPAGGAEVAGPDVLAVGLALVDLQVQDRLVELERGRVVVAAIQPRHERERAARPQHAQRLGEGGRAVGHQLVDEGADDQVDRRVRDAQRIGGGVRPSGGAGRRPDPTRAAAARASRSIPDDASARDHGRVRPALAAPRTPARRGPCPRPG